MYKFNPSVINLETGIQENGDSVNYQSLNHGVEAMEALALKFTGREAVAPGRSGVPAARFPGTG
jgi:hypothetical protein